MLKDWKKMKDDFHSDECVKAKNREPTTYNSAHPGGRHHRPHTASE